MGNLISFKRGNDTMANKPSVLDVAKYFLKIVDREAGSSITHLKLQKLVYYAQAWHLVFTDGKTLFDDQIQAWVHGPASPRLFNEYRSYGFDNIPEPKDPLYNFSPQELETLNAVWECYGDYDGKFLEELAHQELPWKEARQGFAPGEHCTKEISLKTMQDYYTKLQQNAEN
jgi:uncharacterized phage-associated protein